ncbi:MAG TPA: helix-turn-helix transcriptional regulator [Gammaproteobacteria bacterium]|nr:helix-turn-helix transcriptional regulator [Gammaproteobacteria bacterium]
MAEKNIPDDELYILRHKNGIMLIDDKEIQQYKNLSKMPDKLYTVSDLFKYPFSIYFLNQKSQLSNSNPVNLEFIQADSLKQVYGKSAFDIFKEESTLQLIKNDTKVMQAQKKLFFDEQLPDKQGSYFNGITIKLPWYSQKNAILGVLGLTIFWGQGSPASSFSLIDELEFLNDKNGITGSLPGAQLGNNYLTQRELEILQHIIEGRPARTIAEILVISRRTVETHIEHIKNKIGVTSKPELIEKALDFYRSSSS